MDEQFLPFEEAREFARKLKLSSSTKWFEYCKSPDFPNNIPKRPEQTFADVGWNGYSDWLGNGQGKYLLKGKGRLSFEKAREFVLTLHLSGLNGWIAYCKSGKRPANIPASPHTAYKDKWKGYGDWTGTGKKRHTDFLPFEEAREFARSLDLFTISSWEKFAKSDKRPKNIPYAPDQTYKKQWMGYRNWLRKPNEIETEHLVTIDDSEMTETLDSVIDDLKQIHLPYDQAKNFVRTLGLKGQKEWTAYAKSDKRPKNIPSAPYQHYLEWDGYADWLGTSRIRLSDFLPFEEAREFARSLNIKGKKEWVIFVQSDKRPIDIPTQPDKYYGKTGEWTNWYDWLGQIRGNSGQGAAVRRIQSRFHELMKLRFSKEEIMDKLSSEFPRKSKNDIEQIILNSLSK
jgi:hypothetical protein